MAQMTYTIYHNPRCSKSRKALELLNKREVSVQIVEYLQNPLSENELLKILETLDTPPESLIRTGEDQFKELEINLDSKLDIAKTLSVYPILMERPVVVSSGRSIIARPPEKVLTF